MRFFLFNACLVRVVLCFCNLPRLNIDNPGTRETFQETFKGKRAVLLEGLAQDWPALEWDLRTWKTILANVSLPLWDARRADATGTFYRANEIIGHEFFKDWPDSNSNQFVFRAKGHDSVSLHLLDIGAIKVPPIFGDVYLNTAVSIGGKSGGLAMFHAHEEAWLTLAIGTKQWYISSEEVQSITAPTVVACTQLPGQTIYVPEYFWHSTGNVRDKTDGGSLVVGFGGQGASPGLLRQVVHGEVEDLAQAVGEANEKMDATLIEAAASANRVASLRWLLDHDAPTSGKALPIHIAAKYGHCDVLQVLAEEKPKHYNIEAIDNEGNRAVHLAAWTGHTDVLRWLVKHKAQIDSFGNNGHVAMSMSAFHGHAEFLSTLVGLRASVELQSKRNGIRALHMAAYAENIDITSLLIGYRADVNPASAMGQPSHISAENGHLEILKLLVNNRADLSLQRNKSTVAEIAASKGHTSITSWLKKHAKASKAKAQKPSNAIREDAGRSYGPPSPVSGPRSPAPPPPASSPTAVEVRDSENLIMHVAYSSTVKGFEMLLSSIASLGRHLKKPWQCIVHVIVPERDMDAAVALRRCAVNGLSKQPLNILLYSLHDLPFQIKKGSFFRQQQADEWNSFANSAAFTKLFLHEYLPMVSKVIWLDVDTIVRSDLTPLFMTPMKYALAAVRSRYDHGQLKHGLEKIGERRNLTATYFQSGVVLIDLVRWRSENLSQHVIEWGQSSSIGWAFAEQVALNAAIQGNYDQLDWWWNVRVDPKEGPRLLDDVDPKHHQPKIFHFFNQIKCWRPYCDKTAEERKSDYLYEYPKQQCFRDLFPHVYREDASLNEEL